MGGFPHHFTRQGGKNVKFFLKIIGWFFLLIFNAFLFWSVVFLFSHGLKGLSTVLLITLLMIDFFIFNRKAYPYRYLIPALFFLFVLVLYPIYFTIKTAFTNYGTGHLITKEEALYRILTDPNFTYIKDEEKPVSYAVFCVYDGIKPTDDFLILFKVDGKLYIGFKPLPKERRGTEILLSEGKLSVIEEIEHLQIVPESEDVNEIRVIKLRDKVYKLLYSPDIPETMKFSAFFKTAIGQKHLSKAEYVHPDTGTIALRIARDGKWRFFRVERLYRLSYMEEMVGNKLKTRMIVVNNRTGRRLIEEDGAFYDIDEDGNKHFVIGYIDYVGTRNFERIVKDPKIAGPFLKIFVWNFVWASLSVVLTFTVGLGFALILNDRYLRGRVIYRTLLIIPWAVPAFISVLVWRNGMFNETYGVINKFLLGRIFGLGPIKWFNDPFWAKFACLTVNTWLGFPYMMTVSLGALQSIPDELYEVASIDGANRWQRFWRITFPLIMTTVAPLLVGSFAFNFNNFVNIYLLTQGGPPIPNTTTPAGATDILISYTYKLAFEGARGQDFGFASAISVIIFLLVAGISFVNFKISGTFEGVRR